MEHVFAILHQGTFPFHQVTESDWSVGSSDELIVLALIFTTGVQGLTQYY